MKKSIKFFLKKVAFLVNHQIQKRRNTTNSYITCSGNIDGIGAQVHAVISTMLFAHLNNITYVHTPFFKIEHNVNGKSNWEESWETFFDLGQNEMGLDDLKINVKEVLPLRHPLMIWKKSNVLFVTRNCHEFTDLIADQYQVIEARLKDKFFIDRQNKDTLLLKSTPLRIAVHIRRGDVTNSGLHKKRFTSDNDIIGLLDNIHLLLKSKNLKFETHVYSQGVDKSFNLFQRHNVILHLNENEFDSFTSLVTADILIMAKSSFSYTAAILSNGFVFYDDFWHRPLKKWALVGKKHWTRSSYELGLYLTNKYL